MGEIRALPPALTAAAADLHRLAAALDAARGEFTGGSTASGGCDPQAAGSFDDMQRAWQVELDRLRDVVASVSIALQGAAQDYLATDTSAVPAAAPGSDSLTRLLLGPLAP